MYFYTIPWFPSHLLPIILEEACADDYVCTKTSKSHCMQSREHCDPGSSEQWTQHRLEYISTVLLF